MKISRIVDVEVGESLEGICFNESLAKKRVVKVKASDKMCSVGMIRRGRSWGDYGGTWCAECPYFIAKGIIGEWESGLLNELSEALGMPLEKIVKELG